MYIWYHRDCDSKIHISWDVFIHSFIFFSLYFFLFISSCLTLVCVCLFSSHVWLLCVCVYFLLACAYSIAFFSNLLISLILSIFIKFFFVIFSSSVCFSVTSFLCFLVFFFVLIEIWVKKINILTNKTVCLQTLNVLIVLYHFIQ